MNSELTEKTDIKEGRSLDQLGRLASSVEPILWPGSPTGRKRARREAAAPRADSFRGWILYDGDCPSCTASAKRFDRIFRRRGFIFLPLQTDWVMQRLGLEPGAPLEEMRVLTADGRDIGGADAVIFLARQIWWARPFAALARLPGIHKLLDRGYRWIAAHRGCDHIGCDIKERRLPSRRLTKTAVERPPLLEFVLFTLPVLALLARNYVAPWQFMWLMAAAIFLSCKWLTFWRARRQIVRVRIGRALGYFFLWPGMDAERFLRPPAPKNMTALSSHSLCGLAGEVREGRKQKLVSRASEELSGKTPDRAERMPALPITSPIGKTLLGVVLLFGVARIAPQPLLAGWIGMIGIILILHFGLFHLLAIGWRTAGIDVKPIMDAPLCSKSVSEFWSRRWNAAFNRLAFDFVFRPLARRRGRRSSSDATKRSRRSSTLPLRGGTRIATLAAFLFSGLIHELAISLPAGAGYGLPTAYFLLQGIGILTERVLPRIRGRIFTLAITAVPAFWLFHPPFVRNVILPFMKAIGAL